MEALIKKSHRQNIITTYSVPMTEEMRQQLAEVRDVEGIDVNEHFRQFAKELLAKVRESQGMTDHHAPSAS